jgi:hypothetical protein
VAHIDIGTKKPHDKGLLAQIDIRLRNALHDLSPGATVALTSSLGIYIYVYMCIYIYTDIYIHVYIYMHIHDLTTGAIVALTSSLGRL